MKSLAIFIVWYLSSVVSVPAFAQSEQVVDISTRPGVTQRMLVITPDDPKATVVLFAGGHGGLQINNAGKLGWGKGNFLMRTRGLFAAQGLTTVVVDAPSDRQSEPYLSGFRQTLDHLADIKAVIAWAKQKTNTPIWLVGTSRGTQSAAFIAFKLLPAAGGPDGLVLTSSILTDKAGRAVPAMPLDEVKIPTLVVHHRQDGCALCQPSNLPLLMEKLSTVPRKELIRVDGGISEGDPCEAMAYHGFNGIEKEVVAKIATFIFQK